MPIITDPEQVVPDIVAFSGQRSFGSVPAGTTRQEFVDAVKDHCVLAGWELLATEVQAHGTGYTLRSQQSPWYNIETIPTWYVGNKIVLTYDMTQASNLRFRVGVDYGGTTELAMNVSQVWGVTDANLNSYGHFILANPYQLVTWTDVDVEGLSNTNALGDFIVSALNNPKNMLQKNQIIHNVVGTVRLRGSVSDIHTGSVGGGDYVCYRTRNSAGSYTWLNNNVNSMVPCGSQGNRTRYGRRIWNRGLDPTMSDINYGSPFFSPPYCLHTLPGNSGHTINGFFWDAFNISEGFSHDCKIIKSERNWARFCGQTELQASNVGASMFFNIDNNLPEE